MRATLSHLDRWGSCLMLALVLVAPAAAAGTPAAAPAPVAAMAATAATAATAAPGLAGPPAPALSAAPAPALAATPAPALAAPAAGCGASLQQLGFGLSASGGALCQEPPAAAGKRAPAPDRPIALDSLVDCDNCVGALRQCNRQCWAVHECVYSCEAFASDCSLASCICLPC
jgi:hypothetical protein